MKIEELAEKIKSQFSEKGIELKLSEITTRLELYMKKFRLSESEARITVINELLKKNGISKSDFYKNSGAELVNISAINETDKWVSLKVKVVQLWDSESEAISQVGLIGDSSGVIKFTKWFKSNIEVILEEGKSYEFNNVTTSEYQGQFSVNCNKNSKITLLDEDIEVGSQKVEFTGAIVNIQAGSGLIKRCPGCNRVLKNGVCGEHERVEGIYDIRIKAVLDNGEACQEILLGTEATDALTGISIDKAKKMATECLDTSVVLSEFSNKIMGRYFKVEGQKLDRFINVEKIEKVN